MLARSKLFLQQRDIFDYPAIERGVVHLNAVLLHHFLELSVADRIRHIPANSPQSYVPFKVTALNLIIAC